MRITRITALLLTLTIAGVCIVSCAGADSGSSGTAVISADTSAADKSATETQTAEITAEPVPDLPDKDFEARTFTFLDVLWGYKPLDIIDIAPEELNGETINDTAYNRNKTMEEKYNVNVELITAPYPNDGAEMLRKAVSAGDGSYDIALIRGTNLASMITSGYLTGLSEIPYIDVSKPWWDESCYDALNIKGRCYAVTGCTTTNHMNAVWTVCFNKEIITNYGLDNPYTLVKDGGWTFDKSIEMAASVAKDLNGDGVMNKDDMWGINHTNDTVMGIVNGCGVKIAEIENEIPVITLDSEKSVSRLTDIYTKLFNETYAMDTLTRPTMKAKDSDGQFFLTGNVLFLYTATHLIWQLRQMDIDFGMLPYPKYSESDDYNPSTAGIFLTLTSVPASNTSLEDTGYFLEAYAYEGWKTLKPAFYDNVLQGKLARDDESLETLDYIYGNLSYDTGNLFNFNGIAGNLANMSATLDTNIASFLAKQLTPTQAEIDKFVENIG